MDLKRHLRRTKKSKMLGGCREQIAKPETFYKPILCDNALILPGGQMPREKMKNSKQSIS